MVDKLLRVDLEMGVHKSIVPGKGKEQEWWYRNGSRMRKGGGIRSIGTIHFESFENHPCMMIVHIQDARTGTTLNTNTQKFRYCLFVCYFTCLSLALANNFSFVLFCCFYFSLVVTLTLDDCIILFFIMKIHKRTSKH